MKITTHNGYTEVSGLGCFDINQTFDCGQCFRFEPDGDGGICGVARGRVLRLTQPSPDTLCVYCDPGDFESIWRPFLDLDGDYASAQASFEGDPVLREAAKCAGGIRILRQEPWETLCSFIISQNNNIPRIKGLVAALSASYGGRIETPGGVYYSFPTPQALADAGEDAIFALKTGFRAKYIYDAASKIASGELSLEAVAALPTPAAADLLCTIKGVGPKVAACTLLFGFGRGDCFPVDVWVKRVLAEFYPGGLDIAALGNRAGIAQQYLFYYKRYLQK